MNNVQFGETGESAGAYLIMKKLKLLLKDKKNFDVFEIHDFESSQIINNQPNPNFLELTKNYYSAFIDRSYVDNYACDEISYAVIIDNTCYYAIRVGANTYIGTGGQSVIDMRSFCCEMKISMIYIESIFEKWHKEKMNTAPKKKVNSINIRNYSYSFGFKNNRNRNDFTTMINEINLHCDIFKDNESLSNFLNLLFSEDLSEKNSEVKIICQTITFSFLLRLIADYWFNKLTAENIQRTNAFITSTGVVLTKKNAKRKPEFINEKREKMQKIVSNYKGGK